MSESTTAMAELVELREHAAARLARVADLEAQQRHAAQTLAAASAALVEFERRDGGTAADRKRLEQALSTARAEAEAPWPERIEGARHAARDADQVVRVFVAANLAELVAVHEMEGSAAAARLNAAAEELIAAHAEREAVARRIAALVGMAGGIRPGDVSNSGADDVVRAAQRLIGNGGEEGPQLRRDRYPALQPVETAVA